MKKILLVGAAPDVAEARRVILEGAGFEVALAREGESVRAAAERTGAELVIVDTSTGGRAERPDVRAALEELSSPGSPSSLPVLVIGERSALDGFDGPGEAIDRPAEKRALLEGATRLLERGPRAWSRRRA